MGSVETDDEVLTLAGEAANREDWATVWQLRDQLRATDMWTGFYDTVCAIAGWHVDRPAGRASLDEAITNGLHQIDMFAEELRSSFGTEPDWDRLEQRIRANAPAPPVELLAWPDYPPVLAPVLERLAPEREALLRERVPAPVKSAWDSALQVLAWVTTRWEHANEHVERSDALDVLDRVAEGSRFACVEYSIVLTQALNAIAIPARRVSLRMRDHHAGVGRGHVVSEAWIDDLGRWVLLDGQNGAWWGHSGEPLSVVDLLIKYKQGDQPPMNSAHHTIEPALQAAWFGYFASASTTGLTWSDGNFVPVFQTNAVLCTERLIRGGQHVAPDLAGVTTGVVDDQGPALTFTPLHPYATGVSLRPAAEPDSDNRLWVATGETFRLTTEPGTHAYEVAAVTPYGSLAAAALHFITR